MLYCSATFTHTYLVMVADDYFYNFVGKFVNIFITDIIHPDCRQEFMSVCESLKESRRGLLVMLKARIMNIFLFIYYYPTQDI